MLNSETQRLFKQNGYVIIPNFVSEDMIKFLSIFTNIQRDRAFYIKKIAPEYNWDARYNWDGGRGGGTNFAQGDKIFEQYGSPVMDALLLSIQQKIEAIVGIELSPTYSYLRIYTQNNYLLPHKDRAACEISISMPINIDVTNLSYDYVWPLYLIDKNGVEVSAELKTGDILIYLGCELLHCREAFLGDTQTQVFMHYVDKNGPNAVEIFDRRPQLGIPFQD